MMCGALPLMPSRNELHMGQASFIFGPYIKEYKKSVSFPFSNSSESRTLRTRPFFPSSSKT